MNAAKKIGYEITLQQNKIPTKWRRYMEGKLMVLKSGIQREPKPLRRLGIEKRWRRFNCYTANPIQETVSQKIIPYILQIQSLWLQSLTV